MLSALALMPLLISNGADSTHGNAARLVKEKRTPLGTSEGAGKVTV